MICPYVTTVVISAIDVSNMIMHGTTAYDASLDFQHTVFPVECSRDDCAKYDSVNKRCLRT